MSVEKIFDKPLTKGAAKAVKREHTFELSLSALVKGVNALKKDFQETTQLASINSQEAAFWLNSEVMIGSKLSLALNIPKTLILEKSFKLHISGTVKIIRLNTNGKKRQLIFLRLDNSYKIQPLNLHKN